MKFSSIYRTFLKQVIDTLISFLLLIILLPVLIISAFLIFVTSSGPILFLQPRVGKNSVVFMAYKFRTMVDKERDTTTQVTSANPDITTVGRVLRRLKIDELPQLFNVLIGEMSLIGPRPCLPETEKLLNDDGRYRLAVKPGLTGLAQVNGNIKLSWEERWAWDRFYVENLSLTLDFKILLKTFLVILLGETYFFQKHSQ